MAKLALLGFSVALAIGAGACVADDPSTSARVFSDDVTAMNVVNEIEIPTAGDDNIDPKVVVVTGPTTRGTRRCSPISICATRIR